MTVQKVTHQLLGTFLTQIAATAALRKLRLAAADVALRLELLIEPLLRVLVQVLGVLFELCVGGVLRAEAVGHWLLMLLLSDGRGLSQTLHA